LDQEFSERGTGIPHPKDAERYGNEKLDGSLF